MSMVVMITHLLMRLHVVAYLTTIGFGVEVKKKPSKSRKTLARA